MREKIRFVIRKVKEGRLRTMWKQTLWIYQYVKSYWAAIVLYTLLGMAGTVVSLLASLVSKDLVDIITGHETGVVVSTFCMMLGLNIGTAVLNQISNYASNYLNMRVDAAIKSDVFSKILVTDWESLANYHTGDLLTRWNSDAAAFSSGVLNFIPNAVIYSFRFISAFAMVVYYDASFAVFALLGMPVSFLLSRALLGRMVDNSKKSAAIGAKLSGFNQEAYSNIQVIKAFDLIRIYMERLKQLQKEHISVRQDYQKMTMITSIILSTVGLLVSYSSYGWGIYRVWSGAISYGTMTMFLGLAGMLTGTLNSLTSLVPAAISLTTSAGRLMDILNMPKEDYSKEETVRAFLNEHKSKGISLKIQDVEYTYKNGTKVFAHASLEAHPHEVIALVGPSGEGKTTMIRLMLSLIQGREGTSAVYAEKDSLPLSPSTRKLFSYVPQGNSIFSGTIAENMRNVKPEATEDEIIEKLKMACAWDFVQKLPEGINSEIKERGGGLSEGQAQRLAIARALLRHSPILLLDEATSALDAATERSVLKNIMKDEYPRTCIITTHRPSALNICKRVYAIRERQCVLLGEDEIEELIHNF